MNIKIIKDIISKDTYKKIEKEYLEYNVNYITDYIDGYKYITKDGLSFNKDKFESLLYKLFILNNHIIKNTIYHILDNDHDVLKSKLKMSKDVVKVLDYSYKKLKDKFTAENNSLDIPFSFLGRFDLLIDENEDYKVIEINSETPAGIPESFLQPDIITPHIDSSFLLDSNKNIRSRLYGSLHEILNQIRSSSKKNILFTYASEDGSLKEFLDIEFKNVSFDLVSIKDIEKNNLKIDNKIYLFSPLDFMGEEELYEYEKLGVEILNSPSDLLDIKKEEGKKTIIYSGNDVANISLITEDYINVNHLTAFFKEQLPEKNIIMSRFTDINIEEDGIYVEGEKQEYIWTFYPMEWIFTDNGGKQFWDLYKKNSFEIINNPLNLISQNKAIWAYIWENINDNTVYTKEEQNIIRELVPQSFFERPLSSKCDTIVKPLFFREGVGIDDEGYLGDAVYQERVIQKKYDIGHFNSESSKGYLTLGFYYGEEGYIGTYNRFNEFYITNSDAMTIPLYIEE